MEEQRTVYYAPKPVRNASVLIIDKRQKPIMVLLDRSKTLGRNYSQADCDILVESQIVGRRHGEFFYNEVDESFYYIDNNSMNGTYINGIKMPPYNQRGTKPYKLTDGDIIRIDRRTLNNPHPEAVLIIFSRSLNINEKWSFFNTRGYRQVSIGRNETNTIALNDMMASRVHSVITINGQEWMLYDNGSRNGVIVNRTEVNRQIRIFDHDVIKIANTLLIVMGDCIVYNQASEESGSLSVHIEKKTVNFGRKVLIRDIDMVVDKKDFVLILGGSGAGKTTLVRAILGDGKADGKVVLDGQDLYSSFKTLKSQIGLVPQFLTLRLNDTVRNTLVDAAKIKLGLKEYSKKDIEKRVDDVLNKVGIKKLENHLICQLSGGQKKKVSVAVQLVGFQKVFICDEPDSGLDAASRIQQMELLKEISETGKIVMVITHEPDDAFSLFTKVVVLAKSSKDNAGHLAYFGNVEGALSFFNVKRLQDIMLEINPPYEGGKGLADKYIDKYKTLRG